MKHKKQLKIIEGLLFISFIFIGGIRFWNEVFVNDCISIYKNIFRCIDVSLFGEHTEYMLISLSLFFSILPLLFLKETVYNIWKSFAVVAFSLLLLLVFTTPQSSGGLFGHTSLFIREEIALYSSILFLILSYIIIAVQAWKTRKK